MNTKSKATCLICFLIGLGIGFAGGGHLRRDPNGSALHATGSRRVETTEAVPPKKKDILSNELIHNPTDSLESQRKLAIERLKTLAWAGKQGMVPSIYVFGPNDKGLDSRFSEIYDLSPAEVNTLNNAIAAAKEKLEADAVRTAKVTTSADGSHILIEVPPAADLGGTIYDDLLHSFGEVLGPERFDSFNELSAPSMASGFSTLGNDSFGLASTRFELTSSGNSTSTGEPLYNLTSSSVVPGQSSSSGSGSGTIGQLEGYYPILKQVIPPGFQPGGAPK